MAKYYIGQLDLRDGQFDKAVLHFEEVIKNQYMEFPARQYLAFALWKANQPQRAKKEISIILSRQPGNVDALLTQGDIAKSEGHLDDARNYWTHALLYAPGDKTLIERLRSITPTNQR